MKKTLLILFLVINVPLLCAWLYLISTHRYWEFFAVFTGFVGWCFAYIFMRHYFRTYTLGMFMPNFRKVGLFRPGKYIIQKRDGSKMDPNAEYFVLRLDRTEGNDQRHIEASRIAIRAYAANIADHLPLLAKELFDEYGK